MSVGPLAAPPLSEEFGKPIDQAACVGPPSFHEDIEDLHKGLLEVGLVSEELAMIGYVASYDPYDQGLRHWLELVSRRGAGAVPVRDQKKNSRGVKFDASLEHLD